MIEIVRFIPDHLEMIKLQNHQMSIAEEMLKPGYGHMLASSGPAFTAIDGDEVIGCSGVAIAWQNRGIAWALLSRDAGKHFGFIHRSVKGFLDSSNIRRIEAFVETDFTNGIRWMKMLGFVNETPETPMRCYTPSGKDCYLFARVR